MIKMMNMIFKLLSLIFIFVTISPNVNAAESYCYRNANGSLFCEKSMDLVPQEFKASAFFKETPNKLIKKESLERNIPNTVNSGLPAANGYLGSKTSAPNTVENNLPSRVRQTVENVPSENITPNEIPPNQNTPSRTKSSHSGKSNSPQIEVFVAKWCPHCKLLEAFLNKENISYVRYDIDEDQYGREVFEEENGGIPITKIGGTTVIGFEERKFKSLIEAQQPY